MWIAANLLRLKLREELGRDGGGGGGCHLEAGKPCAVPTGMLVRLGGEARVSRARMFEVVRWLWMKMVVPIAAA
jgi:hypothetical protein